jgi:hypothetical protein
LTKPNPKSVRYIIELVCDKGEVYAVKLYDRKRNTDVKRVLVDDVALLFQYRITYPQMLFLENIQKMLKKFGKVPCSINKIINYKG